MDPLAREFLGEVRVVAMDIASLAVVRHEILAQVVLHVVRHRLRGLTRRLLIDRLTRQLLAACLAGGEWPLLLLNHQRLLVLHLLDLLRRWERGPRLEVLVLKRRSLTALALRKEFLWFVVLQGLLGFEGGVVRAVALFPLLLRFLIFTHSPSLNNLTFLRHLSLFELAFLPLIGCLLFLHYELN